MYNLFAVITSFFRNGTDEPLDELDDIKKGYMNEDRCGDGTTEKEIDINKYERNEEELWIDDIEPKEFEFCRVEKNETAIDIDAQGKDTKDADVNSIQSEENDKEASDLKNDIDERAALLMKYKNSNKKLLVCQMKEELLNIYENKLKLKALDKLADAFAPEEKIKEYNAGEIFTSDDSIEVESQFQKALQICIEYENQTNSKYYTLEDYLEEQSFNEDMLSLTDTIRKYKLLTEIVNTSADDDEIKPTLEKKSKSKLRETRLCDICKAKLPNKRKPKVKEPVNTAPNIEPKVNAPINTVPDIKPKVKEPVNMNIEKPDYEMIYFEHKLIESENMVPYIESKVVDPVNKAKNPGYKVTYCKTDVIATENMVPHIESKLKTPTNTKESYSKCKRSEQNLKLLEKLNDFKKEIDRKIKNAIEEYDKKTKEKRELNLKLKRNLIKKEGPGIFKNSKPIVSVVSVCDLKVKKNSSRQSIIERKSIAERSSRSQTNLTMLNSKRDLLSTNSKLSIKKSSNKTPVLQNKCIRSNSVVKLQREGLMYPYETFT